MGSDKNKLEIKVPVYTSEIFETGNLVGSYSQDKLIEGIKKIIEAYTLNPFPISDQKQSKTTKREIDTVTCEDCSFFNGNDPALLVKITAHNTNFADGYYQSTSMVPLGKDDKIGSYNNFFVLYPNILSIDPAKCRHQWIVMVYEDPHKNVDELLKTVKLVLKNILKIPVRNIKLKEVAEELKDRNLTELRVKYHTVSYDTNEVDAKHTTYMTSRKITTMVEETFANIPFVEANEIVEEETKKTGWDRLGFRLFERKKEYRINKIRIQEAMGKISSTSEAIFNERIVLEDSEHEKVYEKDFILAKLEPILLSYISSTDDN